ncbi:MAG: TIGR03905 family TSCPD domain-containing protein [Eubacteriales bacterium]|nr:TIGR03905 family TSCPD domain-containing protein [Eubacteriales bacterium]
MQYRYKTSQVCSSYIDVEIEGNILKKAEFIGGCNGNLKGISSLVTGMTYNELKAKLEGIRCGFKSTSCPDQLVKAVEQAIAHQNNEKK